MVLSKKVLSKNVLSKTVLSKKVLFKTNLSKKVLSKTVLSKTVLISTILHEQLATLIGLNRLFNGPPERISKILSVCQCKSKNCATPKD